jgi:hypothetical protein
MDMSSLSPDPTTSTPTNTAFHTNTTSRNRAMMAAAILFGASTAYGTVVGFREHLPSEPLGASLPGTALSHPATRWHLATGTSAPWPMPALCLVAAACARPGRRWPQQVIATVGSVLVFGILVEPVSWGRRSRRPHVLATVALNTLSAVALFASPASDPAWLIWTVAGRTSVMAGQHHPGQPEREEHQADELPGGGWRGPRAPATTGCGRPTDRATAAGHRPCPRWWCRGPCSS